MSGANRYIKRKYGKWLKRYRIVVSPTSYTISLKGSDLIIKRGSAEKFPGFRQGARLNANTNEAYRATLKIIRDDVQDDEEMFAIGAKAGAIDLEMNTCTMIERLPVSSYWDGYRSTYGVSYNRRGEGLT